VVGEPAAAVTAAGGSTAPSTTNIALRYKIADGAGLPLPATALAAAGAAAWLALTALIPARMAASRRARPFIRDVNGT
jgi:hypothetical protein